MQPAHPDTRGFFRFLRRGAKCFSPPLSIGAVTVGNDGFAKRVTQRAAAVLVLARQGAAPVGQWPGICASDRAGLRTPGQRPK